MAKRLRDIDHHDELNFDSAQHRSGAQLQRDAERQSVFSDGDAALHRVWHGGKNIEHPPVHKIVVDVVQPVFDHSEGGALPMFMESLKAPMASRLRHRQRWDRQPGLRRQARPHEPVPLLHLVAAGVAALRDRLAGLLGQEAAAAPGVEGPAVVRAVQMAFGSDAAAGEGGGAMAAAIVQGTQLTVLSAPHHQGSTQQGHGHRFSPKGPHGQQWIPKRFQPLKKRIHG